MKIEKRLAELGLTLPPVPSPIANYIPAVRSKNLLFLSGHGPGIGEGKLFKGKLGKDLNTNEGYDCAKFVALRILSTLKDSLGDLDLINRIIKMTGFINSMPGFIEQPEVLNGASDLFMAVFREKGQHARSAIGMVELPMGIPVEIEMIVEISN